MNAAFYGVPQARKRAIVIGSRVGPALLPPPTLTRKTVRDAIGDLSFVPDGQNLHAARNPTPTSIERYKAVPPGGNRFDLMRNRPDITPACWKKKKTGSTSNASSDACLWDEARAHVISHLEFFKPEKGR